MTPVTFALPGDIDAKTGGTIYDKAVIEALRAMGRPVAHLALPGSFPFPPDADMDAALHALRALPPDRPVIIDGLAFGALATEALSGVRAPLVSMTHHPLGLETGLAPDAARHLLQREAANLALARHVIVPSPHTARILAGDFGVPQGKISIAAPGFAPPDPVRAPIDPPLILAVGLLAPRKGHDVLINALLALTDLRWQAVIAGGAHDPATAGALAAQAAPLGDRLRFAGRMEQRALSDLYRQATLFALATRYEGYGMVFGEALLHGLPIVTCAAGAVPETVPQGTGILVPVDDALAFADALRRLLTDAGLQRRMADAATAAGHALPQWTHTAAVFARALDTL